MELYFRYEYDGRDAFIEKIDKVNFYIFNEDNMLVESKEYLANDLIDRKLSPIFHLQPGRYNVVAVGNMFDNTMVNGLNSQCLDSMYIHHPSKDLNITTYDRNYIGRSSFDLGAVTIFRDTVDMELSYMCLYFELTGIKTNEMSSEAMDEEEMPYKIVIENVNDRTNFSNEIIPGYYTKCYPKLYYNKKKGIITSDVVYLYKFHKECNHVVKVYDVDQEVVASVKLEDYLDDNSGIINPLIPEIRIPMEFKFVDMNFVIKVPDWTVVDINTHL